MTEPEGLQNAAQALNELRDDPWFPYPEAVDLLAAFGDAGVPDLIAGLDDPNPRLRSAIARALGASRTPAAINGLMKALSDPAPDVKRSAVAAIADQPGPEWVEPLGELLLTGDETVQLTAAQILGQIGAPAIPALATALQNYSGADPWIPGEIASALGQSGSSEAVAPLIQALQHPLAHVRQAAIEALVQLGAPAQPIMQALYEFSAKPDEDPYLRQLAADVADEVGAGSREPSAG